MRLSDDVVRLPIWGETILGNTGESKKDIMKVDESLTMEQIFTMPNGIWDKSREVRGLFECRRDQLLCALVSDLSI